jgi:hypothetical protein
VAKEFPRNYFRNCGFKTVNLRWLKDFRFQKKYALELSAEMFNLFHFANVIIGPAGIPDHKSTAWESTGSPAPRRILA